MHPLKAQINRRLGVCRRCPVVALLLLGHFAAPFLCADGITFNDTSGVFDATGFMSPSGDTSSVSVAPSSLHFAVVTGGYFVTSSQKTDGNFTATSGPAA